jgi:hypothetical protein
VAVQAKRDLFGDMRVVDLKVILLEPDQDEPGDGNFYSPFDTWDSVEMAGPIPYDVIEARTAYPKFEMTFGISVTNGKSSIHYVYVVDTFPQRRKKSCNNSV